MFESYRIQGKFSYRTSTNVLNTASVILPGPVKNERNNNCLLSLNAVVQANNNSYVPSR